MNRQGCNLILLFMVSILALPIHAFAWGIVHDPINYVALMANYHKLFAQYRLLQRSYQTSQQQLGQAKQLTHNSEGHYGFGGLMNSSDDLTHRAWSPSNWTSALHGISGGNAARYQALLHTYQHDHPSLSQSTYQQGASRAKAKVYSQDVQVNRAAMVNATYSFNTIKTHLHTIYALSQKIDQAPNTKAAMDLNSRLLTEMAYIQTQELKMQIMLNQQMAQAYADHIAEKTASARFNTLPTH